MDWTGGEYWKDGSYDVETKEIDEKDFDYNNKVKVRIVGYHNSSRAELPTKAFTMGTGIDATNICTKVWYWISSPTTT